MAAAIDIKAIVTMTHSGYTAFKISSMRPKAHIFAFTSNRRILNMLNLVWGVRAAVLRQDREHRPHHRRHQAHPAQQEVREKATWS
jgi:pyruvate kinase